MSLPAENVKPQSQAHSYLLNYHYSAFPLDLTDDHIPDHIHTVASEPKLNHLRCLLIPED